MANKRTPVSHRQVDELQAELETLKEKLGPLAAILSGPAAQSNPEPAAPRDVLRFPVDMDGKLVAQYEEAGTCEHPGCGLKVFTCISHPLRADQLIGQQLAVFVTGAVNQPPQTYCQAHDPHRAHRFSSRPVGSSGEKIGDTWTPLAVQAPIGL